MKDKRYMALILAGILFAGTALAGCGSTEEEVVEEPEVMAVDVVADIVPIEDEEETILVVGDQEKATKSVQMTNEMGGTITGLAVKEPEDETYPANLMKTDQWLEEGEKADVYYEPENMTDDLDQTELTDEDALSEDDMYGLTGEEDEVMTQAESVQYAWLEAYGSDSASQADVLEGEIYDQEGTELEEILLEGEENDHGYFLQVTMDNGDVYELAYFDIDDMDEVSVCVDGAIAYLQYTSLSKQTMVNTKAAELIIKSYRDAAEEVISAINALPAVTELNAEIVYQQTMEARTMYDNLTEQQKAFVTNYAHLVEEERSLGLIETAEEAEVAEEEVYEEVTETYEEESYDSDSYYDSGWDDYSDYTEPTYDDYDYDSGYNDNDDTEYWDDNPDEYQDEYIYDYDGDDYNEPGDEYDEQWDSNE